MYNFTVNFAGLNINITAIYDYTYNFCKDYLTEGEPDFSVETTEKKILEQIEISEFTPPKPYAESICIYREIAEKLPLFDRLIFHGAAISYNDEGYIFTAPSGTGKTTHISLWKKYLGDGVEIINGDKPIIQFTENGAVIHSTPYAGKEGWQNHSCAPLKAICIVNRGEINTIEKIGFGEHLSDVFKQVYRPYDTNATLKTLELFNKLSKIPLYLLKCDISQEAVETSFEALSGLSYNDCKL